MANCHCVLCLIRSGRYDEDGIDGLNVLNHVTQHNRNQPTLFWNTLLFHNLTRPE